MKTLKFILQKILIVEVMLIILFIVGNLFGVSIPIVSNIISTCLTYLTPISIISLILYIILCILSIRFIEIALGIVLGGIILYYIFYN